MVEYADYRLSASSMSLNVWTGAYALRVSVWLRPQDVRTNRQWIAHVQEYITSFLTQEIGELLMVKE